MADIIVNAGGNLQAALDSAAAGDVIKLQAGATFSGNFTAPAKASVVTLTTNATLPDRRIAPGDSLAKLSSPNNSPALQFNGAHWLVDGIDFAPNSNGDGDVVLCNGQNDITLRRCRLIVPSNGQQKRFIQGNGTNITVHQCYGANIWKDGQDSQFFCAWDGAGPYTITDNYIEAASENIMFGGADASDEAHIPADITIEDNLCTKNEDWRGQSRNVKNLFELKCAKRVEVRRNTFEKNWTDGQTGTAIVFTPVNQNAGAPFTIIEDVLFEENIIRDTEAGISITGYGYEFEPGSGGETKQTTGIVIKNNFWYTTTNHWALIASEVGTLVMDHNTFISDAEAGIAMILMEIGGELWAFGEEEMRAPVFAVDDFTFRNNFVQGNEYGIKSDNGFGNTTLTTRTVSTTWNTNVIGMAEAFGGYPATTAIITKAVLWANLDLNYRLITASIYNNAATDGTDIGWNGMGVAPPGPTPPPTVSIRYRVRLPERARHRATLPRRNFTVLLDYEKRRGGQVQRVKDPRDPEEVSPIEIDWTTYLDGESIAEITSASAESPLTEDPDERVIASAITRHWLTGGTDGTKPKLRVKITTNTGRVLPVTVEVPVETL